MSQLVQDVAARLKIPDEEAELVLRALGKLIRKQAAQEGYVHVPEIGAFRVSDDTLTFDPDKQLSALANHRYGGLKPLPLLAALEGGHDTASREMPEDLVLPMDQLPDADAEADEPLPAEEKPAPAVEVDATEDTTDEADVEALSPDPIDDEAKGHDELAASVSEVLESEPASVDEFEVSSPDTPEPAEKASDEPPVRRRTPQRQRSRGSWWVVALLAVGLVLAGAVWFMTADQAEDPPVVTEETAPGGETASTTDDEPAPDATETDAVDADAAAAEEESPEPPQVDLDIAAGGYTLIVESRASRTAVEDLIEAYREVLVPMGYPVGLLAPREDETRYRLGVGQFEDIDSALEARAALAGQIPDDAWVLGIRPEMDPDA